MELKLRGPGGSLQSEFSGSDFPVSEWANEILAEALLESPIVQVIAKYGVGPNGTMLKRGNKKTYFPVSSATTLQSYWTTGVTDVRTSHETPLDLGSTSIDPVEYRTFTPVANETIEEMDGVGIEEYVRSQLLWHGRRRMSWITYNCMDSSGLDSAYDWQDGGESLSAVDSNTAIDWGDSFTVDNVISGFDTLIGLGYIPNATVLAPAMYADLFQESQFTNAAQYGAQNTAITEGKIPRFMGIDFVMDPLMPDDDQDRDVGIMADWRFFTGLLVAKENQLKYKSNQVQNHGDARNLQKYEYQRCVRPSPLPEPLFEEAVDRD